MVVPVTFKITNAFGDGACKGPIKNLKIEAINNLTLGNIFLKLCKACQIKTMSAIPPSAFSAGRIREAQRENRDMKLSNTSKGKESTKFFNTAFMELTPMKYNSKLMNSIWGLYNRYSPHNVKKINDALVFHAESQQSPTNATNMNEAMISLPSTKLENVWAAINVPQSH